MDRVTEGSGGAIPTMAMNMAEYGQHLGRIYGKPMSRQAVHKRVAAGSIPKRPDGKIDVKAADVALLKAGVISSPGETETDPVPGVEPDHSPVPVKRDAKAPKEDRSFYEEKALTEAVQREILEMKLATMKGSLVRVADVADAAVEAGRRLRSGLDALIAMADDITTAAIQGGSAAVRTLLKTRITEIESTLASEMSKIAAGAEADEGEEDDAT